MPTYDFRCLKCSRRFSREMSMSERSKSRARCPRCNSQKVEQVLASFFAKTSKKS